MTSTLRLFVALVGATAKGRKGTSWSTPRYVLSQVDPTWARTRIKSGLSSGEGLIHNVRDRQEEEREVKQGKGQPAKLQRVVVDAGEPDKRLLIVEPELAVTLKVMTRQGNTLSAIIREAWDSGDLAILTKNSPERATGAHMSIIGHITEEELRRNLTETERANGFANRFLWLLVRRSQVLPEGGRVPDEILDPLIRELAAVVDEARRIYELTRDDVATAMWRRVYEPLSEGKPGLVGAIISRAEAQVLRLSALYAALDGSATIRPPHLEAALALWQYAEASAHRIFGDRLGDPLADLILNALQMRRPMTETEIARLFSGHKPATEIQAALATLNRLGRVRCRPERTSGRPATVWEAT